ncbi:MAG: hypothetical protein M3Y81_21140 [Chloroflexota bacterium]|nr:hypothetical protein [Chloroflexota bacterium]
MDHTDIEHVRTIARSLAEKAWSDETFREQVQDNPGEVLVAAGLPEQFIGAFLQEAHLSDVAGYGMEQQCLISDMGFLQDFIY